MSEATQGGGAVLGTDGGGDSSQAGAASERNSLFAELAFESPPFDGGSLGDLRRGDFNVSGDAGGGAVLGTGGGGDSRQAGAASDRNSLLA